MVIISILTDFFISVTYHQQPATDFIATHNQDSESFKFYTITKSTIYNSLDIRMSTGPDRISTHFLKEWLSTDKDII